MTETENPPPQETAAPPPPQETAAPPPEPVAPPPPAPKPYIDGPSTPEQKAAWARWKDFGRSAFVGVFHQRQPGGAPYRSPKGDRKRAQSADGTRHGDRVRFEKPHVDRARTRHAAEAPAIVSGTAAGDFAAASMGAPVESSATAHEPTPGVVAETTPDGVTSIMTGRFSSSEGRSNPPRVADANLREDGGAS